MSNLLLLRATKKVMTYLDEQVQDQSCGSIEEALPFIGTIQRMFPQWVLQTCVNNHPGTRFISENCGDIFGYTASQLLADHYPLMLFSHIHEEDIEDLHQCFLFIEQFLREENYHPTEELRFVFQYRIRHKNGHFVHLYDEKASLHASKELTVYYSLLRDISHESVFSGVKLDIYTQGTQLRKIIGFKPSGDPQLSKREDDILGLIRQGFTNKEIAAQLKISPNTARNIRQKIFKRYNVSNSIELLNKAIHYN